MKRILCLLLITTVFWGCKLSFKKGKKDTKINSVKSHEVKKGNIIVKLEETGEIEPISEVKIKSKLSGKVLKFHFEEGDFVKIGDIIAEIEPDFNQASQINNTKDNLKLAEINLRKAQETYNENLELIKLKYISEEELQNSLDDLDRAKISYKSSLQQFELIEEIDTEGNISRIISPASGTLIQILVEEGEMVVASSGSYSEGTIIAKLADLNQMTVNASINEVDIAKIKKNQKAEIQVDAYPYESYEGVITKIAAMAILENNVKVFPIEIKITDSDIKLKPGMTANVTIIGEEKTNIVLVPIRTIFSNENGDDIIYKVENDTISGEVLVKTGINDFQNVEIIEGVLEGENISFEEPKSASQKRKAKAQFN